MKQVMPADVVDSNVFVNIVESEIKDLICDFNNLADGDAENSYLAGLISLIQYNEDSPGKRRSIPNYTITLTATK